LNANRVTLTTGTALMSNGNLDGFRVQRGVIDISGAGMDSSQADYTDLIARAVQINAGLWANTLKVTTGANDVSLDQSTVTTTSASGSAPVYGIDTAALGGMYAGKITLVGTEAGVGVRNLGTIGASAGDVIVTADGRLENAGHMSASGNIQTDTHAGVVNSGSVYAQAETRLNTAGTLNNSGTLAARGNTTLTAAQANSQSGSVLAAGLNSDGTLAGDGVLTVSASGALTAQGQNLAGATVALSGSTLDLSHSQTGAQTLNLQAQNGDLIATGATLAATNQLQAGSSGLLRTDAATVNAPLLNISAHDLSNVGGQLLQTGSSDMTLTTAGHIDNTQGRIGSNSTNLTVQAATLTNQNGRIEHSGNGTLDVSAQTLNGQGGSILAAHALNLHGGQIDVSGGQTGADQIAINANGLNNTNGKIVQSGHNAMQVSISGMLDNHGGTLGNNGDLNLQAGQLNNAAGLLQAAQGGTALIGVQGALDNSAAGQLIADGNVQLSAASLNNSNGKVSAGGTLSSTFTGLLDNTQGTLVAGAAQTLHSGNLLNQAGNIQALNGALNVQASNAINNGSGQLQASQTLNISAQSLANAGVIYAQQDVTVGLSGLYSGSGTLASVGNLQLTAGSVDSSGTLGASVQRDGAISGSGALQISSTQALAAHGQLLAVGGITLDGGSVDLSAGKANAAQININAHHGTLSTANAVVSTAGTLTLSTSGTLNNEHGAIDANQLNINAGVIDNHAGSLLQTGSGDTTLAASQIDNSNGTLGSNGANLSISTAQLNNGSGTVQHAGNGTLNLGGGDVLGSNGHIISNGTLALHGNQIVLDGGTVSAQALQVTAAALSNVNGQIAQYGSGAASVTVTGALTNTGGTLGANGDLNLHAASLDNRGGTLQAAQAGALGITVSGTLDNRVLGTQAGRLAAAGNSTISAGTLDNGGGQITAGGSATLTAQNALDNSGGNIASNGALTISAAQLNNAQGNIGSVQDAATLTTTGSLNNQLGHIDAAQALTLNSSGLNNLQGHIVGQNTLVNAGTQTLDNTQGTLGARGTLGVQSGALNNTAGLIQSTGALSIDSHGQTLTNTQSGTALGIISQSGITLHSGDLNNSAGFIGAATDLTATTGQLSNGAGGVMTASQGLQLSASGIDNRGGQLQAVHNATLNVGGGSIDNSGSLIGAGDSLSVTADSISNRATQGQLQGLQGHDVSLNTNTLDNQGGNVFADATLSITGRGQIDNSLGKMSGQQVLIQDSNSASKAQTLVNGSGQLVAGQRIGIDSASINGVGSINSYGDISFNLSQSLSNDGQIQASRNLDLTTAGVLNNNGIISANGALHVRAADLNNSASAELSGQSNTLDVSGTLTNRGLIDGGETDVNSGALINTGTGRIYGDHIAIGGGSLSNQAENGVAAVIASRSGMDLGVSSLSNRNHALIFAAGDMAIGGALDGNHSAVGQASSVYNGSAQIQAMGNLSLSAQTVTNANLNFSVMQVVTSITPHEEYTIKDDPTHYDVSNVEKRHIEVDIVYPAGCGNPCYDDTTYHYDNFVKYLFNRTVTDDQVANTDPALISSGGNLTLNTGVVTNNQSHILAGATLGGTTGSINNVSYIANETTSDSGTQQHFYRIRQTGSDGQGSDPAVAYNPAASVTHPELKGRVEEHASTAATGSAAAQTVAQVAGALGDVTALDGQTRGSSLAGGANVIPAPVVAGSGASSVSGNSAISSIALNTAAATTSATSNLPAGTPLVVRTIAPNTTLPNNALFKLNPGAQSGYLIETDPRFANYQTWLSSDYLLQQLQLDPATTQKRLGDGFYEQQLVRDQVAQLTGRRFLDGYSSDQAEYQALLSNGATMAKAWNLTPGVALTDAQVAQLTSDVVWLVSKTVTLPDGSTTQALVPQVYVRVKQGDIDGNGAVIGGNNVALTVTGDLTNSGTIAGRNVVAINAQNVQNLNGRISGDSVGVRASNDLANLGGMIDAASNLNVSAGHDLKVASTTSTQTNASGSTTNVSAIAGLYVSNAGGTLVASAGHDLTLTGAEIVNSGVGGSTSLSAGNNINLGTVATGSALNAQFSADAWRNVSTSSEAGSSISSKGNVTLNAGNDLNLRAANVTSENGQVAAIAQHDINLSAGQTVTHLDEASKTQENGRFSHGSTRTHDILDSTTHSGSTLSGNTVVAQAGHDLNITGSNVASDAGTSLTAGNDVKIVASIDTQTTNNSSK
ncbi:beta strand repeat-containing protein, partial [Amantichitinum ursilacus]|uniref:beta strand repeat-containing protein n=1 Tax=Amantichitinum ursilacus TaxID=857265 RepID=UPI000B1ACC57